jgi:cytochrome c oxidase subunit II
MFAGFSLVLVAVSSLWLYAMLREPDTGDEARTRRIQNRWIVGGGIALPVASITVLLALGIPAGHSMLPLPPDEGEALEIRVIAHQWWWEVVYPEWGISLVDELHIPAGSPVDVHLSSADVIHSFWVPRLGGKLDAVPGRTHVLRIQADEPGSYRGQCAEFCGTGHAHMHFMVIAHAPGDFEAWQREAQDHD